MEGKSRSVRRNFRVSKGHFVCVGLSDGEVEQARLIKNEKYFKMVFIKLS